MSADVLRDARYAVRQLGKTARLLDCRRPHAGARHRRHQRDLQRRQRRAAAAAAVSRAGWPRSRVTRSCRSTADSRSRRRAFSIGASRSTSFARDRRLHRRHRDLRQAATAPSASSAATVSWDLFDLLEGLAGARPRLHRSRGSAREERRHRAQPRDVAAPIRRRSDVLGRTLTLSGEPVTIVGVMPPDFFFPSREVEFWRPIALNPANATRGGHFLGGDRPAQARASVAQASAEMKTIAERLAQQYPDSSANESAEVIPLKEQMVGSTSARRCSRCSPPSRSSSSSPARTSRTCCSCARPFARKRWRSAERSGPAAAGWCCSCSRRASCSRSLGGGLGLLLAYLAIAPVQALSAGSIPRVSDIAIDGRVLAFRARGDASHRAWSSASRRPGTPRAPGIGEVLKEGGRSSVTSSGRWLRNGLMVAEVALSIVLLVGAVLLLRSFGRITGVDPGFRAGPTCWPSASRSRTSPIPRSTIGWRSSMRCSRSSRAAAGARRRHGPVDCRCAAITCCRSTSRDGRRRSRTRRRRRTIDR